MSFHHKVKENIIFLVLIAFVGSILASCVSTQATNLEKMSDDERYKVLSSKSDSALCNGYTGGYIEDKTELQIEEILRSRGISKCKRAINKTVRYVPSSLENNTKTNKKNTYISYVEKYANVNDKCQGKSTIQNSKDGISKYLVNCSDGREISYICQNNECSKHLTGGKKGLIAISPQSNLMAENVVKNKEQSKNSSSNSSEEMLAGYYYVNADSLNARYEPKKTGELSYKLYKREKIKVYEVKNGWARLGEYFEGQNGKQYATWTYTKYLSKKAPKKDPNLKGFSLECQIKNSSDTLSYKLGNRINEMFVTYNNKTGEVSHTGERGKVSTALVRYSKNTVIYTFPDPTYPENKNFKSSRYIINLKNLTIIDANGKHKRSKFDKKGSCKSVGDSKNITYTNEAYQGRFVKFNFKLYTKSFESIGIKDKLLKVDLTVENKGLNDVKDFDITCRTWAESGTFLGRLNKIAYNLVKAKTERVIEDIEMGLLGDAINADCEVISLEAISK